jgi:ferredoxin
MAEQISRRSFLKGGLVTAAGLAACSIPGAATAAEPDEEKQLATLLDIRKCIGCEACVEACSEVNFEKFPDPQKPFPEMFPIRVPVEDWSEKKDVNDRLTPYNWLFIQHAEVDIDGYISEKMKTAEPIPFMSRRCNLKS